MQIDKERIERVSRLLNELAVISSEKVYDKSIVLKKVKIINQELEQLNTIRKEVLLDHKQRENNLYKKFDDQHRAFETLHSEVQKYIDELNKYDALTDPPEESPTLDLSEEKQKAWMEAITVDHGEVSTVLHNYNWRRMSSRRKRWLRWSNLIFRSDYWTHQLLKLFISATVGFGLEKLCELVFDIPDFVVFFPTAILLFFTLDRILEKRIDRIFWKKLLKHTVILKTHYTIYLQHLNMHS